MYLLLQQTALFRPKTLSSHLRLPKIHSIRTGWWYVSIAVFPPGTEPTSTAKPDNWSRCWHVARFDVIFQLNAIDFPIFVCPKGRYRCCSSSFALHSGLATVVAVVWFARFPKSSFADGAALSFSETRRRFVCGTVFESGTVVFFLFWWWGFVRNGWYE